MMQHLTPVALNARSGFRFPNPALAAPHVHAPHCSQLLRGGSRRGRGRTRLSLEQSDVIFRAVDDALGKEDGLISITPANLSRHVAAWLVRECTVMCGTRVHSISINECCGRSGWEMVQ